MNVTVTALKEFTVQRNKQTSSRFSYNLSALTGMKKILGDRRNVLVLSQL